MEKKGFDQCRDYCPRLALGCLEASSILSQSKFGKSVDGRTLPLNPFNMSRFILRVRLSTNYAKCPRKEAIEEIIEQVTSEPLETAVER